MDLKVNSKTFPEFLEYKKKQKTLHSHFIWFVIFLW